MRSQTRPSAPHLGTLDDPIRTAGTSWLRIMGPTGQSIARAPNQNFDSSNFLSVRSYQVGSFGRHDNSPSSRPAVDRNTVKMVRYAPTPIRKSDPFCDSATNTFIMTAGDQAQPDHRQEPLVLPFQPSTIRLRVFYDKRQMRTTPSHRENADRYSNQTSERTGNVGFNVTSTRYALDGDPTQR